MWTNIILIFLICCVIYQIIITFSTIRNLKEVNNILKCEDISNLTQATRTIKGEFDMELRGTITAEHYTMSLYYKNKRLSDININKEEAIKLITHLDIYTNL